RMGRKTGRVCRHGQQVLDHLAAAARQPQGRRQRCGMEAAAARVSAADPASGGGDRRWPGHAGLYRQRFQAAVRDRRQDHVSEVLELASALIARPSVTPDDAGCQALIAARLARAGFAIEHMRLGEVDNLWATHGNAGPVLVLLGHTDVVPPGPVDAWSSDPFVPTVRDGMLYGRGAADMKGSVAAFVIALERFVIAHPDHP